MVEQNTPTATPGEVSLKSNWLRLDGAKMWADVLPLLETRAIVTDETLHNILVENRFKILDGIVDFTYNSATIEPSIFSVQLGTTTDVEGKEKSKVLTMAGYANGGILQSMRELRKSFYPYWHATHQAGFKPQAMHVSGKDDGGVWMQLRRPTLLQVSDDWLSFSNMPLFRKYVPGMKATIHVPKAEDGFEPRTERENRQILGEIQETQVAAIEAGSQLMVDLNFSDEEKDFTRTSWEVGALISLVALKQAMEYSEGVDEGVATALEKAKASELTGVVRAIENATYTK